MKITLSCDNDDIKELSPKQKTNKGLTIIENNAAIIDDVIVDGTVITAGSDYHYETTKVKDRDSFIGKMMASTASVYSNATKALPIPYTTTSPAFAATKLRTYLKLFPSGFAGPNGTGLIDLLEQELTDSLERKKDSHAKQIVIDGWSFDNAGQSAANSLTLDVDTLKGIKIVLEDAVVATYQTSYDPIDIGDADALAAKKVFIGLLVPAITVVRPNPSGYHNLINSVFDFTPAERTQWDHDVRAVAYYAIFQYMISQHYHHKNEYEASLEINRQVFDAIMVMVWAKAYDVYK